MEDLMLTEIIDKYLAGKMSDKELQAFQAKLAEDEQLKREVELQREVISAIRKQALRKKLEGFEQKTTLRSIIKWSVYTLVPLAVAACMAALIILPQIERVEQLSQQTSLYAAAWDDMQESYSSLRGSDHASDAILTATQLMQNNQYSQADAVLEEGILQLSTVKKEDIQLWCAKEDMLYLRALCAIKQNKVYLSRYLLYEVIQMDVTHKEQAERLLNTIKGNK